MTEITVYVVRKNSLALPHCDENDCEQYFFHSRHFQPLSFSTLKRPKSEKKTVKINQKGDIIAGLSLSDLAKSLKSFCLRDRGRLGNRGRPIWLKFGTLSCYGDLCNMPKFQLHCSYLGWVLDVTLFGVPEGFFYSLFWALFNTLITMSGIF